MHPELQRLLLLATVNKTHLSYKRGRWTNRCTQCGMSAGPWWRKTDAQLSALLHWLGHHQHDWSYR